MSVKNQEEIGKMRLGGKILVEVLAEIVEKVKPGITTQELNDYAERKIKKKNAQPSFLEYQGFPKSICTSINEEIVHGIPSDRRLEEGDILSIDLGIFYQGFHTDAALTVPVGRVSEKDALLIKTTRESLINGLSEIKDGVSLGSLGYRIQKTAEDKGFSVVRDLTGHAVGRELHEDPSIPNFGDLGSGQLIGKGETLAIEPMLNQGEWKTKTKEDGWTVITIDGKKSAHFESTVLVTEKGCENLTPILS